MLYVLLGIVIILAIIIMTRPDTFRIERSTLINAPAATVFPLVEDFHQWRGWSPFEEIDPTLTRTYEGADHGVGAVYKWSGNNKAGEGRMEIIESVPSSHVRVSQQFTRPFKMDSTVEFLLEQEGEASRITWAMFGKNQLMSKIFGLFVNMDKMLGKDFDKGLNRLKALAESRRGEATSGGEAHY
mgnify:FL=1